MRDILMRHIFIRYALTKIAVFFLVWFFSAGYSVLSVPEVTRVPSIKVPYNIKFSIKPPHPRVGKNVVILKITDSNETPVEGATVKVISGIPGMPLALRPWISRDIGHGQYETTVELTMDGLWEFKILIDGKLGHGETTFQREVKSSIPPNLIKLGAVIVSPFLLFGIFLGWRQWGPGFVSALMILILIIGAGWLWTKFLHKPHFETMGMPMDMSLPDMGMPIHLLNSPKPVAIEEVKENAIFSEVVYTGNILADAEEIVYSRVTGWLMSMPFYPGDKVKTGEIIGVLDNSELSAKTNQAYHEVLAEEHDLVVATQRVNESRSMLEKSKAALYYWEREFPRAEKLLKEGAISQEEYDKEKFSFDEAKAEVSARENDLEANKHSLLHHKALIAKANAALKEMKTVEGYTSITTRLGGVVTERMINAGVLVSPGMGIIKVSNLRHIRVQANVSEKDLAIINVGTTVNIMTQKLPGKVILAKVTAIFHTTDPMSRTGRVEIRIPNSGEKLYPGDFAEIRFMVENVPHAVSVPRSALVSHKGAEAVWIVEHELAKRRYVKTGISNGSRTQILDGLKSGEKVIYAGHQDIQEDDPVKESAWGSGSFKEILFPLEQLEME